MTSHLEKNGKTSAKLEQAKPGRRVSQDHVNGKHPGIMAPPTKLEDQDPTPVTTSKGQKTLLVRGKTKEISLGAGDSNLLTSSSLISNKGGVIKLGTTGVKLEIPPNAFHSDDDEQKIQIRILPHHILDEDAECFEDHSTTMVEILPNRLKLKEFATLTLPHCLIVKNEQSCKIEVYQSHHTKGQRPSWEDISDSSNPKVSGTLCKIMLKEFSWIRFNIDDKWVEGKKLYMYTRGEMVKPGKSCVTALVGYLPALPEYTSTEVTEAEFNHTWMETLEDEIVPRYFKGGHWQSLIFKKDPRNSLMISIASFMPSNGWEASSEIGEQKIIAYGDIETSQLRSCPFTFNRLQAEVEYPTCHFKISHLHGGVTIFVNLEVFILTILD